MKKLLTLMIMLGLFAMPSITTKAFTLNDNDIPITQLGGLTLNEVFLDSNIVFNGTFDNNSITGWDLTGSFGLHSIANEKFNVNKSGFGISFFTTVLPINTTYYVNAFFSNNGSGSKGVNLLIANTGLTYIAGNINPDNTTISVMHSNIITTNATSNVYLHLGRGDSVAGIGYLDNIILLDLTTLGLTSLNKIQIDHWFYQWQLNNAYIEGLSLDAITAYNNGFNDGYINGYGEGYNAGVAEDNAYSIGYARGLTEGQDMETGSSILIFVVAAIGFIMMIFGFTTKRGIFNLLSVGAFVVLGAMLAQYIGFIIIAIGLVLINVYYAFWGDL